MLKVLIVDDEELIRRGTRSLIERLGIFNTEDIYLAGDAREGISVFNDVCPDIVITDIRMPRINGLDMIKEMQKADTGAKYIIVSGYGDFDYAKEALKLGVTDYLLKPVSGEELRNAINKVINNFRNYR